MSNRERADRSLPTISGRYLHWFARYVAFYLRKNFHGFHLLRVGQLDTVDGWPLLICVNHPSWWDPLTSFYLSRRFFPGRRQYAPIAAGGLAKYKFFERLGFFGIDLHTFTGAATFLKVGQAVLTRPDGALWVTPQGGFRDVRESPVLIEPGVGHLARRLSRFAMLPLALEYTFWNERYPEAFACFGNLLTFEDGRAKSAKEWNHTFSRALENTQHELSEHVKRRDRSAFEQLLDGNAGVGGFYDIWRSMKSRVQGKRFEPEHGGV